MNIELLAHNKKIIPIYYRFGDFWHTNIKLPDILVTNRTSSRISLMEVEITGSVQKKVVVIQKLNLEDIAKIQEQWLVRLNKLLSPPPGPWKTYNLQNVFGDVPHVGKKFSIVRTLEPSDCTALLLSKLWSFHYEGLSKIDGLELNLIFESTGQKQESLFPIPLTFYRCKGKYTFPIRGCATIAGLPHFMQGHRVSVSQEFALDVEDLRRIEDGRLAVAAQPKAKDVNDYFLFDREVHAIGKGIVVASGNRWPDEWARNPLLYSVERVTKFTQDLLDQGMEFTHAILGNYAIIDHRNGEFSLYAHMREGSVTVDPGDKVKQGQVIGRVGNTSNSTNPHLHFQLMDSGCFPVANGLPVVFQDVPLTGFSYENEMNTFSEANSMVFSDYLFVYVEEK